MRARLMAVADGTGYLVRRYWLTVAAVTLFVTVLIAGVVYTHLDPSSGRTTVVEDKDCADFADWATAQKALENNPGDPYRLDGDGDGVACEGLQRNGPTTVPR